MDSDCFAEAFLPLVFVFVGQQLNEKASITRPDGVVAAGKGFVKSIDRTVEKVNNNFGWYQVYSQLCRRYGVPIPKPCEHISVPVDIGSCKALPA